MTAAGQDRLARAAAALRPYLPRYADDELRALARVVLDAVAEPAGQDGELVTDEMVGAAYPASVPIPPEVSHVEGCSCGGGNWWHRTDCTIWDLPHEEALAAERVARERVDAFSHELTERYFGAADRWSSSGRAPAGEEEQR